MHQMLSRERSLKELFLARSASVGAGAGDPTRLMGAAETPRDRRAAPGSLLGCLLVPDVLTEEGEHPLPGIGGRGGVVGAPLVIEEGVLRFWVHLQVMRDASRCERWLQYASGPGGEVVARP